MSADWIAYGYLGIFAGSFLAATLLPLPSEILLVSALGTGFDPFLVLLIASIGNTLGGLSNYGLGYAASNKKLLRFVHINVAIIERWEAHSQRWGYWLGLLAWLPFVGDPMLLALGFIRTRFWPLTVTVFLGKLIRYCILTWLFFATT